MATRKTAKTVAPKAAKARGPKAGSAQTNQSVKGVKDAPKANADEIRTVTPAKTGNGVVIVDRAGNSCVVAPWQDIGSTRKLAVVGGSLKAVREHIAGLTKPKAQLARGVEARQAPQSAAAVRAQPKAEEAKPAKGKAAKAAAPKAAKNKQPSKGADRAYKATKKDIVAKEGSWRRHLLETVMAHSSTDAAKAAHAKSKKFPDNKLDFNFCANQGYIVFAK